MEKQDLLKVAAQERAKINKDYGDNTVISLSDKHEQIEAISTGSLGLDIALGIGGLPRGRVVEIIGMESSGKTTICIQTIVEAQKKGGLCAIIDMEQSFDASYAENLGVDLTMLDICQPDSGDMGLEITDRLISTGLYTVIVVDSVAALVPKSEIEKEMGESVSYDTPIYIRNKQNRAIEIVPICDLYKGYEKFPEGRHQCWYRKFKTTEILTHQGWKDLKGVIKKENVKNKSLFYVRTMDGMVKGTEDHCYFVNNVEKKLCELNRFDRLDTYSPEFNTNNKHSISEDVAWLLGFWIAEGSTLKQESDGRLELSNTNLSLIEKSKVIMDNNFCCKTEINKLDFFNKSTQYRLICSKEKQISFLLSSCLSWPSKIKKIPIFILNAKENIKKSFLDGFFEGDGSHNNTKIGLPKQYYNDSLCVIGGLRYLLRSLGIKTHLNIHTTRPQQCRLHENTGKQMICDNEIRNIIESIKPEFLYDIETEVGTFVTPVGDIVIHNSSMGKHALLMAQACRKITPLAKKHNTLVIFINQIRNTLGNYGNPEVTPGGLSLRFYASVRLDIRRSTTKDNSVLQGDVITGNLTKVKVLKSKVSMPFKTCEFNIIYGQGTDKINEVIQIAHDLEILKKWGKTITYKEEKFEVPVFEQMIIDNEGFYLDLRNQILDKVK